MKRGRCGACSFRAAAFVPSTPSPVLSRMASPSPREGFSPAGRLFLLRTWVRRCRGVRKSVCGFANKRRALRTERLRGTRSIRSNLVLRTLTRPARPLPLSRSGPWRFGRLRRPSSPRRPFLRRSPFGMGSQGPASVVAAGGPVRYAGSAVTRARSRPLRTVELNASPRLDWRGA